jgi:hypothetical protein
MESYQMVETLNYHLVNGDRIVLYLWHNTCFVEFKIVGIIKIMW